MSANQSIEIPEWSVGYVYLLDTSDRYQKIGFSRDPVDRVLQFRGMPFCVWLLHAFPVGTKGIELAVHEALAPKRVRGEWFILTREEVGVFCSIPAARYKSDLPNQFLVSPFKRANDKPEHKRSMRPGRKPRPWYRTARKQWYLCMFGVQHPLRVYDPTNYAKANEAAWRLVMELHPTRIVELEEAVPPALVVPIEPCQESSVG